MAMRRIISALTVLSLSAWRGCAAAGKFDLSRSDNIALYWGQSNLPLSDVCKNDDVNIIPISFLTNADGQGTINLAGNCDGPAFPGTGLLDCHQFEQDIKDCQSAGKIVVMSLGGAGGSISFSSDDEAKAFGESFYKNFLGGNSSTRPFGDAILDGIDLDLESPGTHRATFVNHTLDYAKQQGDNRKYYITGAPQCPCEDANMKDVMASAPFDAVFVQFYNNPPCQLTQDVNMKTFNFGQWFGWFKGVATLNKDTKIFVGAPGDPSAAGSGYADSAALAKYIDAIRKNSTAPMFGGMMFWDAPSAMSACPSLVYAAMRTILSTCS
ncbi:glycoside hydrolase [Lentinus tigrinus ALCF2SS1-7]|uniref:glycoside hydrolase n=1 Tax=Lentinus tigrinus ALCF2SS1-7 TaxID=1328758 RepID=UPI0011663D1C|nr:glycoside hydrolase [Lentinus tigrinus ALCF2SS1-7]